MVEKTDIQPGKPCAICGKPSVQQFRPFCSKRCADVDLNRWLSGHYVVPGAPDEDEDGEGPAGGQGGQGDRDER